MFQTLKQKLSNCAGFSFIEAILATVLLSAGLWGGLALLHNATEHSSNSDYRVIATQLANEKVETMIADKAFKGYDWIIESNYPDEQLSNPYSGFTRTVSVLEVDPTDLNGTSNQSDSGYKRIDIQVTWGSENYKNVTIPTVVTKYDTQAQ